MNIPSLPRYRGLPDAGRGWGEPDGHGKKPTFRMRDFVVLCLLVALCYPLVGHRVNALWSHDHRVRYENDQLNQAIGGRTKYDVSWHDLLRDN